MKNRKNNKSNSKIKYKKPKPKAIMTTRWTSVHILETININNSLFLRLFGKGDNFI